MATFGITPVGDFPPASADSFPRFIQFQLNGVNLGGPDADTVNFVGANLHATRGTGENANVITVTVEAATTVETVTATQEQTVVPLVNAYTIGDNSLEVSVNGAVQVEGTDYTETSTTSITFATGLNAGDVVLARVSGITAAP